MTPEPDRTPAPDDDAAFDRLRRRLSDDAFEPLARRPATWRAILVAVAGLALTVLLIRQSGGAGTLSDVFHMQRGRVLGFFVITNIYVLLKGLALKTACRSCGVRTSVWETTRTFCESSLIGLVVAKIASDVYKYARITGGSRSARVRAVLVYRIAAIIGVLLLSSVVSIMWADRMSFGWFAWLVPAIVLGLIVALYRTRVTTWIRDHGSYVLRVLPFSVAAIVAKIAGLTVLLGVSLDGRVVEIAAAFLVIGSLASMTQVPAGLGTLDAGYAVFLTKYLGVSGAETAAFLVSLRLLGPVYVALLGALSMGGATVARLREARRGARLDAEPA